MTSVEERQSKVSIYEPFVSLNASVEPPDRSLPRLFKSFRVGVGGVHHVVQLHHDVGTDRGLIN